MLLIEAQHFRALEAGVPTPQRIAGQRWPDEDFGAGIRKM